MTSDLDGRGPQGEQLVARSLGVAVHVDQDVDPVLVDPVRSLPVAGDLGRGRGRNERK